MKRETWQTLEDALSGSFSARATSLLGSAFSLSGPAGEFGRLELSGFGEGSFRAGGLQARVERVGTGRRMVTGDEETLAAHRRSSGGLKINLPKARRGGSHEAGLYPLRNLAVARSSSGDETARVKGTLTGRSYEVSFSEGSLAEAVFLLLYLATLRRRAFRALGPVTQAKRR